jgi:hypothetical protein
MADDIERRLAMLEQAVSDLWKCIDALYAKHGQNSPRWAQRRDMALYYENRRKALNVTPNGASIITTANAKTIR